MPAYPFGWGQSVFFVPILELLNISLTAEGWTFNQRKDIDGDVSFATIKP